MVGSVLGGIALAFAVGGSIAVSEPVGTETWTNSLGMRFASVPGVQGAHFSIWETRVSDFRAFTDDHARNDGYDYRDGEEPEIMQPDGWAQRGWAYGWDNPGFRQSDDHPVTCVSWEDARAFCAWLTGVEREAGRIGRSQAYRLPKDWEWSVAVGLPDPRPGRRDASRDGGERGPIYPWGSEDRPPLSWGNYCGDESLLDTPPAWTSIPGYIDGYPCTSPVGAFGPRHGALCDMGGNVWEWVDVADTPYTSFRCLRGGSWSTSDAAYLRSAVRESRRMYGRRSNMGFRIVLDSESRGPLAGVSAFLRAVLLATTRRGREPSPDPAVAPPAVRTDDAPAGTGPAVPAAPGDWVVPDLKLRMKWIPPGRFMMGSTPEERAWAVGPEGEGAAHMFQSERGPIPAMIAAGFWLGETPVTVGQWKRFIEATGHRTVAERRGRAWAYDGLHFGWIRNRTWRYPGYRHYVPREYDPVVCLAWMDANAFCDWLTRLEREAGRLPDDMEYRLPAEVEWEYACRGGLDGARFWWGNSVRDGKGRLNVASVDGQGWRSHWGFSDGSDFIAPVDTYGARGRNGYGLADMLGNVWEFCLDGYDPNGPHPEPWFENVSMRVSKGHNFTASPGDARCAVRSYANEASAHHGFRVALGRVIPREGALP